MHAVRRAFELIIDLMSAKKIFFYSALVLAFALGISGGALFSLSQNLPDLKTLQEYTPKQTTRILDIRGRLIDLFAIEKRTLVTLEQIPSFVQHATLAIEDERFYQHHGIDFVGIGRAVLKNLKARRIVQGGSTITQQLAKNLFLTSERKLRRKLREVILAWKIENGYSKQEILRLYLNQIYYGAGAYGIESASRTYFGKHVWELNIAEGALLAGLPKSPNEYNPYRNPLISKNRQEIVLHRMMILGYLLPKQLELAKAADINLTRAEIQKAPYFVEYIRLILSKRYGTKRVYGHGGGLIVETTLDLDMQKAAQDSFEHGLAEAEKRVLKRLPEAISNLPLQGALVAIEPSTGAIRAMVGGKDFRESPFNRAVQAQRQPGSAFKPFVYTTAFDHGLTPATILMDQPKSWPQPNGSVWSPANFGRRYGGPTTLRDGLRRSVNVVAVRLIEKVGVRNVMRMAKRMGIKSKLRPQLGLALGISEVNLLELVSAYTTLANSGIRMEPHAIVRVRDNSGKILEENSPLGKRVLSPRTAYVTTSVMRDVLDYSRGTGRVTRRLGFHCPGAGKTGTTENNIDAWFVGFTPALACGVWIGFDIRASMGKGQVGGTVAAPIWAGFMTEALSCDDPPQFPDPGGLERVEICQSTGYLPVEGCPKNTRLEEVFIEGSSPTQHCDVHTRQASPRDFRQEDEAKSSAGGTTLQGTPEPTLAEGSGRSLSGGL